MTVQTARVRLERSRQILLRQIQAETSPRTTRLRESRSALAATTRAQPSQEYIDGTADSARLDSGRPTSRNRAGFWPAFREVTNVWWHHHPARTALSLLEPILGAYGRAYPARVLGTAAVSGAAIVLLRVWRVLPVSGLLVASLRSSHLPSLAASLVAAGAATLSLPENHDANQRQE